LHVKKGEVGISELSKLRAQHELLCCTIQKISSAFQLVLFISTTYYILEVTFSLYNSLQIIILSLRQWNTQSIVIGINANLSWALLLAFNFAHLAWQCEQLAIEVFQKVTQNIKFKSFLFLV
jgi:hypothetical protein